jgi:hypothetical protein
MRCEHPGAAGAGLLHLQGRSPFDLLHRGLAGKIPPLAVCVHAPDFIIERLRDTLNELSPERIE